MAPKLLIRTWCKITSLVKTGTENHTKCTSIHTFHLYSPIWRKFCTSSTSNAVKRLWISSKSAWETPCFSCRCNRNFTHTCAATRHDIIKVRSFQCSAQQVTPFTVLLNAINAASTWTPDFSFSKSSEATKVKVKGINDLWDSYKLLITLSLISLLLFQKDLQTNLSSKVYLSLAFCTSSSFRILKLITVTILDDGCRSDNLSKLDVWPGEYIMYAVHNVWILHLHLCREKVGFRKKKCILNLLFQSPENNYEKGYLTTTKV